MWLIILMTRLIFHINYYWQVSKLLKAYGNNLSANAQLSKIQLSKIVQLRGFLGRLLGSLLKAGLSLIKIILKPLDKSIFLSTSFLPICF